MRYQEVEAAITGLTSEEGPFPLMSKLIDGSERRVFGGLPDSLRDYYAMVAGYADKDFELAANEDASGFQLHHIGPAETRHGFFQ